jgi:hypothetical protein
MTNPPASTTDAHGERVYPIPRPGTSDIVELPSVSRVLGLMAKPGLEVWKQKQVAEALSSRPDLVTLAATDAYSAVRQALEGHQAPANVGTSIHALTVKADRGELDLGVLDSRTVDTLHGYLDLADAWGWDVVASEATVYNFRAGYAGTFDRILDVPNVGRVVSDIKTGSNVYPETALQIACYANAEGVWSGSEHQPMPSRVRHDLGWVIHLRPDGGRVVPVDLSGAWAAVTSLCCVWRWRARADIIRAPATLPRDGSRREWLTARIEGLKTFDGALERLAASWPGGIPTLKNTDSHTAAQLEQIERAIGVVEKVFRAPFVERPEEKQ